MPPTVSLVSPEGVLGSYPAEEAAARIHEGFTVASSDQQAAQNVGDAAKANIGVFEAAGQSAGNTATFGASGAAQRAIGGDAAAAHLRLGEEAHPIASIAGMVGTAVLDPLGSLGAVSKLGHGISELGEGGGIVKELAARTAGGGHGISELGEGGGIVKELAARTAGGAAEGGVYGLGSGVAELANSDEPITAEHVASVLGSKALLTGLMGGGLSAIGKGVELGLGKASAALRAGSEAQAAIGAIPDDLAGLDAKALREAETAEKTSLKTQTDVEEQALKDARVPERKQLSDDIHEYQKTLADAKIYTALKGEDAEAVDGVSKLGARMAKYDTRLRDAFDNPIKIEKNPSAVLDHLTGQEAVLRELETKIPELKQAIDAGASKTSHDWIVNGVQPEGVANLNDLVAAQRSRADVLDKIPDALTANKQLQARIEALHDVRTPVSSPRLTELKSGTSPRLTAIQNARDALANAPDKGFVQKAAEGAAFAGGTAFALMIPGVGIAAPFVGKYASEAVGALFGRLAGTGAKAAQATADHIDRFLGASKLPAVSAPLASSILSTIRYAAPGTVTKEPAGGKYSSIQEAYRDRSAELRSQTMYDPNGQVVMRPEVRAKIGAALAPLAAVNPLLADKTETVAVRKIEYTSSKIPRKPEMGGVQIGPDRWSPSDAQIRAFARTVAAVEDPAGVEERLAHGTITTEDADAYRNVYPERWKALTMAILPKLGSLKQPIPMARRIALQIFTGQVIDPSCSLSAQAVFQGNFKNEAGSAGGTKSPVAQPHFGAMGSIKKSIETPTPSQKRSS